MVWGTRHLGRLQSTISAFSVKRAKKYQLIGPTLWLLFIKGNEMGASSENRDRIWKRRESVLKKTNIREQDGAPGKNWSRHWKTRDDENSKCVLIEGITLDRHAHRRQVSCKLVYEWPSIEIFCTVLAKRNENNKKNSEWKNGFECLTVLHIKSDK